MSGIASWLSDVDCRRSPIYVLHGIAGIGKSTIAQTVAERAAELGYLGASFFFSRNEERRKNAKLFFSSVAFQLSQHDPDFAIRIGMALEHAPDAASKRLPDQLKELIIDPLIGGRDPDSCPILFIVDALDECEPYDGKEILTLLAQEIPRLGAFKVLITTRPEQHIRKVLHGTNHENFRLHEIEDSIIESDIRLYLNHMLSEEMVQKALPELEPPPWVPKPTELDALVRASGKLFIVASTAILFILDDRRSDPRSQIVKLLEGVAKDYPGERRVQALDDIYMQILRTAIPEHSDEDMIERFQKVVGTIVLLQNPLPPRSLAYLLGMTVNDINGTLNHLHSITAPSSQDHSPQIYHTSFPDFITDSNRCNGDKRFFIVPPVHHSRIAVRVFHIMNHDLRENICDLGFPEQYVDNDNVYHLVDDKISPELRYACLYWADHLSNAGVDHDELLRLVENFAFNHLLHWLEVLSFIGRLDVAYPALEHVQRFAVSWYCFLLFIRPFSHKNDEGNNGGF